MEELNGYVILCKWILNYGYLDKESRHKIIKVYIWLIINANITDGFFRGVEIPKGATIRSIGTIARYCNLSIKEVRLSLTTLIEDGQISIQTNRRTGSLIQVLDYGDTSKAFVQLQKRIIDKQGYFTLSDNALIIYLFMLLKAYSDKARRGQINISVKNLGVYCGLDKDIENRSKNDKAKSAIKELEDKGYITKNRANKGANITICKYDYYEDSSLINTQKRGKELNKEQIINKEINKESFFVSQKGRVNVADIAKDIFKEDKGVEDMNQDQTIRKQNYLKKMIDNCLKKYPNKYSQDYIEEFYKYYSTPVGNSGRLRYEIGEESFNVFSCMNGFVITYDRIIQDRKVQESYNINLPIIRKKQEELKELLNPYVEVYGREILGEFFSYYKAPRKKGGLYTGGILYEKITDRDIRAVIKRFSEIPKDKREIIIDFAIRYGE